MIGIRRFDSCSNHFLWKKGKVCVFGIKRLLMRSCLWHNRYNEYVIIYKIFNVDRKRLKEKVITVKTETAVWNKVTEILMADKPSCELRKMMHDKVLFHKYLDTLYHLENIPQNLKYHPEGSVWNHTVLVVDQAARMKEYSANPIGFMWAAVLHDIGKIPTTRKKKGRIVSYNHDSVGSEMTEKILEELRVEKETIQYVVGIVRWHMQPLFVMKSLPFANIRKMIKDISPTEIALFSFCDRRGRGNLTVEKKKEEKKSIIQFMHQCTGYVDDPDTIEKMEQVEQIIEKQMGN